MKPLLSIVVPVYNAEHFVAKTIENLLQEKNINKEIILVNDGSTDGSLNILRLYEKQYECIKVINQPNRGASAARNAGMDLATGELIYFNDCDDLQEPNTLTYATKLFKEYDVDAVIFSYKHVGANNNIISSINYLPTGLYSINAWSENIEKLINTHIISNSGTTIRKLSILRNHNIRYIESFNIYEDIIFGFSYLRHVKNLYYINTALYSYVHINANSLYVGYHSCLSKAVPVVLENVERFSQQVLKTQDIPYIHTYASSLFKRAILNEAVYLPFFSRNAKKHLATLADSSYMSYIHTSDTLLPKSYYWCLSHRHFTILMFIAGIRPKTTKYFWSIIIPIGRFVKRKIFRLK